MVTLAVMPIVETEATLPSHARKSSMTTPPALGKLTDVHTGTFPSTILLRFSRQRESTIVTSYAVFEKMLRRVDSISHVTGCSNGPTATKSRRSRRMAHGVKQISTPLCILIPISSEALCSNRQPSHHPKTRGFHGMFLLGLFGRFGTGLNVEFVNDIECCFMTLLIRCTSFVAANPSISSDKSG